MIEAILREWCLMFHGAGELRRTPIGGWRCQRCGVSYADLHDAGLFESAADQFIDTERFVPLNERPLE